MLKNFIHQLIERRHYWRTVGFSEMAELYMSRLLRLMAVNMIGGIASIYLYRLGYEVWMILMFFGFYAAARALWSFVSAHVIARVGPKHTNLISNILYLFALIALLQVKDGGIPMIVLFGVLLSLNHSLYIISYHVNFSKVRHVDHMGKELGSMAIFEKIGAGISPLVGGLIAYTFGPETTIWIACLIFFFSSVPLFLSAEPTTTRQHITFRGVNWRQIWHGLVASASAGADMAASLSIWMLFLVVIVFQGDGNIIYAQVGGLATLTLVASVIFAKLYGSMIDRRGGGQLLLASSIANSVIYLVRPFIGTPVGAVVINIFNEAATSGFRMPFLKGQFDQADNLPGYRIVYMALMDCAACLGEMTMYALAALVVLTLGDTDGLKAAYFIAALLVLPVAWHRFPALRYGR